MNTQNEFVASMERLNRQQHYVKVYYYSNEQQIIHSRNFAGLLMVAGGMVAALGGLAVLKRRRN